MKGPVGIYNAPAAVTFTSLALAVGAVLLSWHGQLALALVTLIWAGICDLLDGWVARRRPRSAAEQSFGLQIDSLVDMAAFGMTPWLVLLHDGRDAPWDMAVYLAYAAAAAMRLAHFNRTRLDAELPASHSQGLPVTYAALVFPVVMLTQGWLAESVFTVLLRVTVAGLALLFLLPVPLPKPRGRAYAVFAVLAVALTWLWLARA